MSAVFVARQMSGVDVRLIPVTPGDFIPIGSPCSKLYGTIKTVTYNILLLETDLLL
ncbi:hypothetical protein ALC57_00404 [Trachymyrmex cornetzi]|uniref:Uncharacterized protein n=1 Tax=Trachymyrmex cornetzi TaxID=471704 RepID=A0A151JSL8_9HYME|nr:hypothetical protein ALC57_00404 [Trachymyrmex cornetzi]